MKLLVLLLFPLCLSAQCSLTQVKKGDFDIIEVSSVYVESVNGYISINYRRERTGTWHQTVPFKWEVHRSNGSRELYRTKDKKTLIEYTLNRWFYSEEKNGKRLVIKIECR